MILDYLFSINDVIIYFLSIYVNKINKINPGIFSFNKLNKKTK